MSLWVSLGSFSDAAAFAPAVSRSSSGMNTFSNPAEGTPACTGARCLPSVPRPRVPGHQKRCRGARPRRTGRARGLAGPSVVKGRVLLPASGGGEVLSRRLPGLAVGNDVEGDLLAFLQLVEAGALDRADVHEDILAAILRLDESVALLGVEPLHGSLGHGDLVFHWYVSESHARHGPGCLEILGRSSVRRVDRGKAKSFGRNSMAADIGVACGPRKGRMPKATEYFGFAAIPGGPLPPPTKLVRILFLVALMAGAPTTGALAQAPPRAQSAGTGIGGPASRASQSALSGDFRPSFQWNYICTRPNAAGCAISCPPNSVISSV